MSDVVSHRTQTAAVNWLTGWTVREIDTLFSSHEAPPPVMELDTQRWAVVGNSVRRDLAARYHAAIDSRNPRARQVLLRIYDEILRTAAQADEHPTALIGALRADGIGVDDDGGISAAHLTGAIGVIDETFSLKAVRDPGALRMHAHRMQRALEQQDPADAILAARELIESVSHTVIEQHGQVAPKNPSTGALYGQAADILGLKAAAIEGDDEASKAAKQVLQGLMNIAVGLGELRTRVGRGHGTAKQSPARQRHAELATNAAGTLALFVLDTLHERTGGDLRP